MSTSGAGWPETEVRQQRLEEAIAVIRLLWEGGNKSHHGRYYTVENARLYTLPKEPPLLLVAVGGPSSAELAGRAGDGFIATSPEGNPMRSSTKPVAMASPVRKPDRLLGQRTRSPHGGLRIESGLPWPWRARFRGSCRCHALRGRGQLVTEDAVAKEIVCGPDPGVTWRRS
jgi:hypothetical protein